MPKLFKTLAAGKIVKIEELPRRRPRGYDWESFLKAMPRGYAQQVTTSYDSAMAGIRRLEREGVIAKGEFTARMLKEGGRYVAFILHHGHPAKSARKKEVHRDIERKSDGKSDAQRRRKTEKDSATRPTLADKRAPS